ncbi:carbohydrate kinase family protein [Candidatus Pacearchaeota archaeon]|nr:carbohydrate kinase family protein [Candidatus Pacearchaeota archaeon]
MYDIITLGSASLDVFVKTKEEIRKHKSHTDLCYHLGEKILVNKLSFNTGGGGTNTAVAFSRLGLKTGYMGVVGHDVQGIIILHELKKEKVDFLGSMKKGNTGYSIILPSDTDRAILSYKGVNNEFSIHDAHYKLAKWLYVNTMLGTSFSTAQAIMKKHKGKVAANISLYLAKEGLKKLSSFLRRLDILVLNKEEAYALTKKKTIHDALQTLSTHTAGIIVITDGFHSLHAYDGKYWVKKVKRIKPVDSTGAGDAFGAGFVYGIMKGKSLMKSLEHGSEEAHSVLLHVGAKNNLLRKL